MHARFVRSVAFGAILGIALAAEPGHAEPDARAIAELLAAAVAATGKATVAYDVATGDGDSVTLSGFKLTLSDGSVTTVPALVIAGIAPREPGGFTAEHIALDHGTATSHGATVTWATASLEEVVIPSADEVTNRAKLRPFRGLSVGSANLAGSDLPEPIDAATISVDVGEVADGLPSSINLRAGGVRLPTVLFANSVLGAIINMLDYQEFIADVSMDGTYDSAADTVAIHVLTVDVPAVGKITLAGKASGFSLRDLTDADTEKSKVARAKARLDTLRVRLDNAGFIERMLDMQAGMLGGTRDDVRSQLVDGALPFALSFVENEPFRVQFQAAVAAFLADPRSLTITAEPSPPVPLGQVVRTAVRAPLSLPDLLAPKVEANN